MANDSGILPNGTHVRMKSGSQGWVEGQIVEYYDVISYPALHMSTYGGGQTPGYKIYVLEGKHKGETLSMPLNYVEKITYPKPLPGGLIQTSSGRIERPVKSWKEVISERTRTRSRR